MNTHNAGGGEVLQYWGKNGDDIPSRLNDQLIKMFHAIPYVQYIIYILILIVTIYMIMKMFNIRMPFKQRGMKNTLSYIAKMRKREAKIIRANKFIYKVTNFIEHTPLALNKSYKDYWDYNLGRADIHIPGGARIMKATEFNGIVQVSALVCSVISVLVILFVNSILGWVLLITIAVFANTMPMTLVRQKVREKDDEVKANFADFYLMLHYVLIEGGSIPLTDVLKSYDKTTTSSEMHRMVDIFINFIETYGEYEAPKYIAKEYRDIPEVGKLLRLIRQCNEGGEIKAELIGFRNEVIDAKEYAIRKHGDRIIKKAQFSFNILMPVLGQAILSAMSIYMKDLGMASSMTN